MHTPSSEDEEITVKVVWWPGYCWDVCTRRWTAAAAASEVDLTGLAATTHAQELDATAVWPLPREDNTNKIILMHNCDFLLKPCL